MQFLKSLRAGASGTTFMTLYSYGYSRFRNKQFREPVLLADLIRRGSQGKSGSGTWKGWLAHYTVGAVFSLTYHQLIKPKVNLQHLNPEAKALAFGGLYGLLGVAGWKATFELHPAPPEISYKEFYAHLVLAHMVFGYFAFGMDGKNEQKKGS